MRANGENLLKIMQRLRWRLPIYQRPYSWGFAQCKQLWNDILEVGRPVESQKLHYLGSLMQCHTDDVPGETAPVFLLIDGQQRLTSMTLLIAAMADLCRTKRQQTWASIPRQKLLTCLLDGDDPAHDIRLELTDHDKPEFTRIITSVVDPDATHFSLSRNGDNEASHGHLTENYHFFHRALEELEDPAIIWRGINRLDVVSIALNLQEDDPQEVFESLNSTGETLSTFDLVRNYVLMNLPERAQNHLYQSQWLPLEQTLRSATIAPKEGRRSQYEQVNDSESFDRFLSAWLTVRMAPGVPSRDDLYESFRHQVPSGDEQALTGILKEMNQYAIFYDWIQTSPSHIQKTDATPQTFESQLIRHLAHLQYLNYGVALPTLMYFLDLHHQNAISDDDLLSLLQTLESYLLRRSVMHLASNGLNKFLPQIIGYMKRVHTAQSENPSEDLSGKPSLRRVFEAALLRGGSNHAMPSDQEFTEYLRTGDCYHFRDCRYLLFSLENEHRPKDPLSIDASQLTIEHILPQNGAANQEWKAAFGNDQELLEHDINLLGNLTLTPYNSELSDGTFAQKKSRRIGGYDHSSLFLSSRLRQTDVWNDTEIQIRGEALTQAALRLWPSPTMTREEADHIIAPLMVRQRNRRSTRDTFARLVAAGIIPENSELTGTREKRTLRARVEGSQIVLDNGESFKTPSSAALTALHLAGSLTTSVNGWDFWTYNNRTLSDIRRETSKTLDHHTSGDAESGGLSPTTRIRRDFWTGLLDYCATRNDFIQMFHWGAGLRGRWDRTYIIFSGPFPGFFADFWPSRSKIAVRSELDTKPYVHLKGLQTTVTAKLKQNLDNAGAPFGIRWQDIAHHRGRIQLFHSFDIERDSCEEAYQWIADSLLTLAKTVMSFDPHEQEK